MGGFLGRFAVFGAHGRTSVARFGVSAAVSVQGSLSFLLLRLDGEAWLRKFRQRSLYAVFVATNMSGRWQNARRNFSLFIECVGRLKRQSDVGLELRRTWQDGANRLFVFKKGHWKCANISMWDLIIRVKSAEEFHVLQCIK